MCKVSFFLFSCVLIGLFSSLSCKVLELNEGFVPLSKNGNWLVMFYAPWCGHCKKLEPTWVEIGNFMSKHEPDVLVGRLDATRFNSLAGLYKIRGFPTIKFFKDGIPIDYNGPRTTESIIGFTNRAKRPAITSITNVNALFNARQKHQVFFLYVGASGTPLHDKYLKVSKAMFTRLDFYSIEKSLLPTDIDTRSGDTLLVFKDSKYYEISEVQEKNLLTWMLAEQFPTYNHLTANSLQTFRISGRPFAIVVLNKNDPFNVTMQGVAFKRKYPYVFFWVEGNSLINSITYGSISVPNLVVYKDDTQEYYVMRDEQHRQAMTKANAEDFFRKIANNKQPVLGGQGFKEQARRTVGGIAGFFVDLFTNNPIIGVVIVAVPSLLIMLCCFCCYTMADDGEGSNYDDEEGSDFEDDEDMSRSPDDVETSGVTPVEDFSEGLRQRVKEPKN